MNHEIKSLNREGAKNAKDLFGLKTAKTNNLNREGAKDAKVCVIFVDWVYNQQNIPQNKRI